MRSVCSPAATRWRRNIAKADIAPVFRANGTLNPSTDDYSVHVADGFEDWRIEVGGLVEKPLTLSLAELRAMPSRTQITRHDCVEGWSCIGEWTGAPLAPILAMARPKPEARYVMFYCADPMGEATLTRRQLVRRPIYYESLDLLEATHPQTILAYELNGQVVARGAWCAGPSARRAATWLQNAQICPAH